ncbi:MAG: tRNA epoxyqueuosine(34) reductase QueG [Candidatus Electryonea clarkiae]|nr:tRNA epoxyqueuosine(34) reductase QueG [Candidatus Electryonea clarkiae]MDP8288160.1 tRNA epoxyqueuosine(34) reductase QueG [Candidatus Electryonea clarkiae]
MSLNEHIKQAALEIGFDFAAIAPYSPPPHADTIIGWLQHGYAGDMHWMSKNVEKRLDPAKLWPQGKTILIVGLNYRQNLPDNSLVNDSSRGRIASYAWGNDYHEVIRVRLKSLAAEISKLAGKLIEYKICVDTTPILEKAIAASTRTGFIGKNTLFIHPQFGSTLFLGELLLNIELEPDQLSPLNNGCGDCKICTEHCPTNALDQNYSLDATKCISYLTIENHGLIPQKMRSKIGNWIFGCDICQECCPYNAGNKPQTSEPHFHISDTESRIPFLEDIINLDEQGFREKFHGTPVFRSKRVGLLRNAAIALGNSKSKEAVRPLSKALYDPEPFVRGHAAWALGNIAGESCNDILRSAMNSEKDEYVLMEIEHALGNTSITEQ